MSTGNAIVRVSAALPLGYGADPFRLTEGQRLHGLALGGTAGEVDLLLQGHVVRARTELSLQPGAQLNLQVQQATADGAGLRLVSPDTGLGLRQLTEVDLRDVALALRLPSGERTLTVLAELMAQGQPLTAAAVQRVLQAAQAAGLEGLSALRAIVWLITQRLPVTAATVALVQASLANGESLPAPGAPGALPADRLAAQARVTETVLAEVLPELPPAVREPVRRVWTALQRLGLAAGQPGALRPDIMAQRIALLAETVGTPLETKLSRLLATLPTVAAPDNPPSDGVPAPPAPPDLRLLLARALGALQGPDAPASAHPAHAAHRAAAVQTLTELTAGIELAQLANAVPSDPADGAHTVWLPLPLPPGPTGHQPTLALTQWDGHGGEDVAPRLRASLTLSLPHLGDLAVHLMLAGDQLHCTVHAPGASVAILRPQLGELAARLSALGFRVDTTARATESAQPFTPAVPRPLRLDHRA